MTEIFDDIRKLYNFKTPCLELQKYIEFFSESRVKSNVELLEEKEFSVKLFPSFTPTIWLNLGASYKLKNGQYYKLIDEKLDVLVLRNTIIERTILPTDNIFTIKFYPAAFEAIFGISQAKIGADIVNVNDIISPAILRKMKRMDSFEDRIAFLESFFIAILERKHHNNHLFNTITSVTENFMASGMALKNNALASKLYLSEKSFYRYFKEAVGTYPKNYFSVVRARTTLIAYQSNKPNFSPYDFGYFDYGHFSKDVLKFTGNPLSFFKF
jgi:AraC-like DNA-binding protein